MMFGPISRTFLICELYSSSVALYHAKTFSPAFTNAAATSSCVESVFEPVTYISAPPAASTLHRYAVFASRCTERATFFPAKGFVWLNSSSRVLSRSQFLLTHSIFLSPDSARLISLIILSIWSLLLM